MATTGSFLKKVEEKRANTAKTALEFKFAKSRIRQLHGPNEFPGLTEGSESASMAVLYWMIREHRVQGELRTNDVLKLMELLVMEKWCMYITWD